MVYIYIYIHIHIEYRGDCEWYSTSIIMKPVE